MTARMAELLAANPARDVEKNLRALVAGALGRLDLVTREEFDVQAKLLARARTQLADARVARRRAGTATGELIPPAGCTG